jgi:hypothetical protein
MDAVALIRFAIGAAGLLFIGPIVLFCLRPQVLRARFEAGPDELDAAAPESSKAVISELKGAGFRPLGVKVEKTPLRPKVSELCFVAGDLRWSGVKDLLDRHHEALASLGRQGEVIPTQEGRLAGWVGLVA